MAEFDSSTFNETTNYEPVSATIQLTFSDGTNEFTDTVQLDAEWVAGFLKNIRTGNMFIRADGSLPPGSPELRPETKHHLEKKRPHTVATFRGWLSRKPAV